MPPPVHPTYADSFRCIGPACEDTCCQGWTVPIDQPAFEKYQRLPAGPLRSLIDVSIQRTPVDDTARKHPFATVRMNAANQCPLLTSDRLCAIQSAHGEEMLSHTCRTYPRIVHSCGAIEEKALALSCPEAARLVLLNPNLLNPSAPVTLQTETTDPGNTQFPPNFWLIRETMLPLVLNRAYPLWQRLFLLSILCQRLDAISRGEHQSSVPHFLADFQATVATGALRPAMDSLPVDPTAQVDVVLRLAGLMLHKSNIRPRFVECIQAFTAGNGNGPGSTLDSLTAHYNFAHDRFFEPFFRQHPHILENYLVNTILRCQFPYGKEAMIAGAPQSMSREFAMLTAQFTLIKGLLIGVAGFRREQFSAAHIVHTVQAAAKHFEHHPEFLLNAHTLLVESQMDGARGIAVLLRNSPQSPASNGQRPGSPSADMPASRTSSSNPYSLFPASSPISPTPPTP
ncbi:MAG: flagellin lysine-N-methylase [Terracidiphilus sp.]